jgi:CRP/FNR family transcriptional regulator, cyclic AMP receptor protein
MRGFSTSNERGDSVPQAPMSHATMDQRNNRFWYRLTPQDRKKIENVGRQRTYDSGRTLIQAREPGRWAAVLLSGQVKVLDASGTRILATRSEGDVIGEQAMLDRKVRAATVTALTPVRALVLGYEVLEPLLDRYPHILRVLSATMSERLRQSDGALLVERDPATRKVTDYLLRAAPKASPGDGFSVRIRSQSALAAELGLSRATVGRVLQQLRSHKIVTTQRAIVVVHNVEQLRTYTAGSPSVTECRT